MLEFVKVLCDILGYDLNPDAEKDKDGKDGAMDDQISFIEVSLCNTCSRLSGVVLVC